MHVAMRRSTWLRDDASFAGAQVSEKAWPYASANTAHHNTVLHGTRPRLTVAVLVGTSALGAGVELASGHTETYGTGAKLVKLSHRDRRTCVGLGVAATQ